MDKQTDKKPNENTPDELSQLVEGAREHVQRNRAPWYQFSRRAHVLIAFYLAVFVLFAALALFVHSNPIWSVDVSITQEAQEEQAPWFRWLMLAISWLGNSSQTWLFSSLIALTALAFWLLRLRLEAPFMIGQSVVSVLLNGALKILVSRPRPAAPLVEVVQRAGGQSFPSGHVMAYVAYWGLLFSFGLILFRREHWWTYLPLLIPAFFVITVGLSRIYLGDHWASDVLGGYLFGGLLLGLSLQLYLTLKRRGALAA